MALISKKVSLQGVPCYDDRAAQTQDEFENNVLKAVRYDGFKLITVTESHIMFKTFETAEGTDGSINAKGGVRCC